MSQRGFDYGRGGIVGIGTPQANCTVEAEMRIVLPPHVLVAVARLTSPSPDPTVRLRTYLEQLETTLGQFDTLRLKAFGFACTASSYLIEPDRRRELIARLEQRFGYPVVTATDAIASRLDQAHARRIALAAPYPADLTEAAVRFWGRAGYDVVAVRRIETGSADTRSIYGLGSGNARAAVEALCALEVDAVLISGTGMPTLPLLAQAPPQPLLLSSNLCLASRLCESLGLPAPAAEDWRVRLAQATPDEEIGC